MNERERLSGTVLEADISVFSVADALHWAGSSRFTGRLRFRQDDHRIDFLLEQGALVNASSSDVIESFGRHLFSEGLVDEFDLAAAIVHSRDNQALIGRAMAELNVIESEVIEGALRDHTINLAELPLEWTHGWLAAQPLDLAGRPKIETDPVDLTFLMIESARREDELNRVRKYLPTDHCTLGLGDVDLPGDTSGREKRILECLQPGATLKSLYREIGGSYHHFLWALRGLLKSSVLQVTGAGSPQPETTTTDPERVD